MHLKKIAMGEYLCPIIFSTYIHIKKFSLSKKPEYCEERSELSLSSFPSPSLNKEIKKNNNPTHLKLRRPLHHNKVAKTSSTLI